MLCVLFAATSGLFQWGWVVVSRNLSVPKCQTWESMMTSVNFFSGNCSFVNPGVQGMLCSDPNSKSFRGCSPQFAKSQSRNTGCWLVWQMGVWRSYSFWRLVNFWAVLFEGLLATSVSMGTSCQIASTLSGHLQFARASGTTVPWPWQKSLQNHVWVTVTWIHLSQSAVSVKCVTTVTYSWSASVFWSSQRTMRNTNPELTNDMQRYSVHLGPLFQHGEYGTHLGERYTEAFTLDTLQEHQRATIQCLCDKRDIFLSVTRGGGRSLCYVAFPWLLSHCTTWLAVDLQGMNSCWMLVHWLRLWQNSRGFWSRLDCQQFVLVETAQAAGTHRMESFSSYSHPWNASWTIRYIKGCWEATHAREEWGWLWYRKLMVFSGK